MKKINLFINKNMQSIITIYFILQPILDFIAGILISYNIPNIVSSIFRILFILFCFYYLFFLKKKEKKYLLFLLGYLILFFINIIFTKDISTISYEFQNTISTFYFPIVFLSLISIFDEYNFTISKKQLFYIYMTYLLLIFVPNILGISNNSYDYSKVGSIGFFNSANSIGAILSICLPSILIYFKEEKKSSLFIILFFILLFYILLNIGTKTPVLCVMLILLLNIIYFIITDKRKRNYLIIASIIVISIGIYFIPKTSFYKNIQIHLDFLNVNNPIDILKDENLIDHFIFSQRLTFLKRTNTSYLKSPLTSKIIGIGYIENYATDKLNTKIIEMDYFDIFYRHGIFGTLLFFYPLYMFLRRKNEKQKDNYKKLNNYTSIFLIFLLALFSGHIFVTPSTSIFVCLIFYYFKENKKYS